MLRRCRAVIFDLDDTLVPTSKIDRAAILHAATRALSSGEAAESTSTHLQFGPAANALAKRFAELLKAAPFPPPESGQDIPTWRTSLWARALGDEPASNSLVLPAAKLAHDSWVAQRLDNFRLSDEVQAMVRRLQAAGYSTGILTNGHADVQRAKAAACDAAALFGEKRVVIAGEYAEQKPHASIFHTACELLGEAADATIMVGDSYAADITGGINAGLLATIWVRPDDGGAGGGTPSMMHDHVSDVPAGKPPPTFTVGSVLELEAILEKIR